MTEAPLHITKAFDEFLEHSLRQNYPRYNTSWLAIKAFRQKHHLEAKDLSLTSYNELTGVFSEFNRRQRLKDNFRGRGNDSAEYDFARATMGYTVTDEAIANATDVVFEGNNYRPIPKRMTGAQIALAFDEQFQTRRPTMTTRIAACVYTATGTSYEYLYDTDDFVLTDGDYAIVAKGDAPLALSNMAIARVTTTRDFVDANWEGPFRWLVARIDAGNYEQRQKDEKRRRLLVKRLNELADQRSSLDKLTKLLADDKEAIPLLEELKALTK